MNFYDLFAGVYDELNAGIDYRKWCDFYLEQYRERNGKEPKTALDLASGTGNMTLPLLDRGLAVTALDASPEMLNVAWEKTRAKKYAGRIFITEQDMTDFEMPDTFDMIVCALDGVNHLATAKALTSCFLCVSEYLAKDGLFFFDIHTKKKFAEEFSDRVYAMEGKDCFVVWQNDWHEKSLFSDFYLTLFSKTNDGKYLRSDTAEREYYHPLSRIGRALSSAGLQILSVFGDTDGKTPDDDDLRLYITAAKEN